MTIGKKDFSKLKIKKPKKEEVKKDDVAKIVEHLRKQRATFKEIDRGAKKAPRLNGPGSFVALQMARVSRIQETDLWTSSYL